MGIGNTGDANKARFRPLLEGSQGDGETAAEAREQS